MLNQISPYGRVPFVLVRELGHKSVLILALIDYHCTMQKENVVRLSVPEIAKELRFSRNTVRACLTRLERKGYISVLRNHGKKTQIALNEDTILTRSNVAKTLFKNEPPLLIKEKENIITHTHTGEDLDSQWDAFMFGAETGLPVQRSLFIALPGPKTRNFRADPVSHTHVHTVCRMCYGTETQEQLNSLTATLKGKAANAVGKLVDAKADLGQLHLFEAWWKANWRSKDKKTGHYQFPRPDQMVEFWWEAMHNAPKPEPEPDESTGTGIDVEDFMRRRAERKYLNK